jgi:hypothetical protein
VEPETFGRSKGCPPHGRTREDEYSVRLGAPICSLYIGRADQTRKIARINKTRPTRPVADMHSHPHRRIDMLYIIAVILVIA